MFKKMLIIAALLLSFSVAAETVILKADNTVSLSSEVDGASVTAAMVDIQRLNDLVSEEPIYLVLNTPGGSIFAGMELIRFAKTSRRPIHTITMFAASMGFQIVQALPGKRLMAESGVLMSHRAALNGVGGQFPGELNVRVDFYGDVAEALDIGVAKRANMSLKAYQALIHDEYYALPEKAIKAGFADGLATVACDGDLSGTHSQEFNTFFGIVNVEFANCPLITNPIKVSFKQETEVNRTKVATEVYLTEKSKTYGRSL
jgi:ATP-dependent Clp protease protease subunit